MINIKIFIIMELSKLLTIVIPCKNESTIIDLTLSLLNFQNDIKDVSVIVCDSSDDNTIELLKNRSDDKFDLSVINGGLPARARNNGMKYVNTDYVLFMDADMFILDTNLLNDILREIRLKRADLITTKIRTTNGKFNYVFRVFDVIQKMIKPITPFCLGGFMLFKSKTFKELGGFDEEAKVAEDYLLSKKVKSRKFKILNKVIFTTPRRFENKGLWYMLKLMVGSYFNRNNKKFFSNHKTYWK
jgi:cellulose synthase/poly-beta-1,6-N-acetylglucosamine synthase-like glycosyltransferase